MERKKRDGGWIGGLVDCWIVGLLDCWIGGLLDCWIGGLLDWWIGGLGDWGIGGLRVFCSYPLANFVALLIVVRFRYSVVFQRAFVRPGRPANVCAAGELSILFSLAVSSRSSNG
jgi:hypothetical protein